MRITTQMLETSMKKSGLYFQNTSLLDFLKTSKNDTSSLLNISAMNSYSQVNKAKFNKTGSVSSTVYKKIEASADSLTNTSAKFISKKDNIFEKENNSVEVYENVDRLITDYNSTIKSLNGTDSPLNKYYFSMLKEAANESSDTLKGIGITVDSKGFLSVDREVLKKSDMDTINKALGVGSKFTNKVNFISQRVSNNSRANLESISGQYSSFGDYYSAYSSKYDLFM